MEIWKKMWVGVFFSEHSVNATKMLTPDFMPLQLEGLMGYIRVSLLVLYPFWPPDLCYFITLTLYIHLVPA